MLGPGNEGAARDALAAWPGGLQVGGGITDVNAQQWIDAGAGKVASLPLLEPRVQSGSQVGLLSRPNVFHFTSSASLVLGSC